MPLSLLVFGKFLISTTPFCCASGRGYLFGKNLYMVRTLLDVLIVALVTVLLAKQVIQEFSFLAVFCILFTNNVATGMINFKCPDKTLKEDGEVVEEEHVENYIPLDLAIAAEKGEKAEDEDVERASILSKSTMASNK